MKKTIKITVVLLLLIFIGIQFIRPARAVPVFEKENDLIQVYQAPMEIARLLKNACYDCHSYHTQYPWYAELAPFSWMIADHIRHGRGEVNYSEWKNYPLMDRSELLLHSGRQVKKGHMPIAGYVRFHPEAQLSEQEKEQLISWFRKTGEAVRPQ